MKASVFIATSLDGYIAREDGSIDWLGGGTSEAGDDFGYKEFIDSVDVIVMGRATFETLLGFDAWPYGDKRLVVLSSRTPNIPDRRKESVEVMSGSPMQIVGELSKRGVNHLYVDGGKTIQGFLAAGLIQRMIITVIPILIGSGIPLFGALPGDVGLTHIGTTSFPNGFVQSTYEIRHGGA